MPPLMFPQNVKFLLDICSNKEEKNAHWFDPTDMKGQLENTCFRQTGGKPTVFHSAYLRKF